MDGIAKAEANEVHFGRKTQATPDVVDEIKCLRGEGILIKEIMRRVGLSKASIYRVLSMSWNDGLGGDVEASDFFIAVSAIVAVIGFWR